MSRSIHLRLREFRAIHRLLGECQEQWADPPAWRAHFLRGVMALTGADSASWVEVAITSGGQGMPAAAPGAGPPEMRLEVAQAILPEAQGRIFQQAVQAASRREVEVPNHTAMMRQVELSGRAVGVRQRYVPDSEWYRSTWWEQYRKPADADHHISAVRPAPSATGEPHMSILTADRLLGDRTFDERAERLMAVMTAEIIHLIGARLATGEHRSLEGLSPRLRDTLEGLLEGQSEKQVALRLGISRTTVHEYVTQLYRHFNVASRGELLAYFIRRRPERKQ